MGPKRPTQDRCWLAFGRGAERSEPLYFRTRLALLGTLVDLVEGCVGNALIAWDFPFGYPTGCGLGGGRRIAAHLYDLVEDHTDGRNNRFEVAEHLNREIGCGTGPFWGRPATLQQSAIQPRRPDFSDYAFKEWRIVEHHARAAGYHHLQSVWKLYTTGSVGSQALMGLALIERLNRSLERKIATRYWPFDTAWDQELTGMVHAECWPSLFPFDHINHPIRDARQVAATRDLLVEANEKGSIGDLLACPAALSGTERAAVEAEEGWILGFDHRRQV